MKRSWKTKSVSLKTSSRRLGKQEMFAGNSVFLATDSVLCNSHICLKVMFSNFCCNVVGIGETLLKKATLDKISELRSNGFSS